MLKLKRIDLLIKNDKIHNESEHWCCDHVQKYKKDDLCWEEGNIFRGVGGCLQFGRRELVRGRRKNMGGEGQQRRDILAFFNGITDEYILSV